MNEEDILDDFKEAVIDQFREEGHVGLNTTVSPDTGETYVVFDGHLIPMNVADRVMLEVVDEVGQ